MHIQYSDYRTFHSWIVHNVPLLCPALQMILVIIKRIFQTLPLNFSISTVMLSLTFQGKHLKSICFFSLKLSNIVGKKPNGLRVLTVVSLTMTSCFISNLILLILAIVELHLNCSASPQSTDTLLLSTLNPGKPSFL